jgi:hypothetical protein
MSDPRPATYQEQNKQLEAQLADMAEELLVASKLLAERLDKLNSTKSALKEVISATEHLFLALANAGRHLP